MYMSVTCGYDNYVYTYYIVDPDIVLCTPIYIYLPIQTDVGSPLYVSGDCKWVAAHGDLFQGKAVGRTNLSRGSIEICLHAPAFVGSRNGPSHTGGSQWRQAAQTSTSYLASLRTAFSPVWMLNLADTYLFAGG